MRSNWAGLAQTGGLATRTEPTSAVAGFAFYLFDGQGDRIDITNNATIVGDFLCESGTGAIIGTIDPGDPFKITSYAGEPIGILTPINHSASIGK